MWPGHIAGLARYAGYAWQARSNAASRLGSGAARSSRRARSSRGSGHAAAPVVRYFGRAPKTAELRLHNLKELVKPLQVIDKHSHRLAGRDSRQQVQRRQIDQEGLGRTVLLHSERRQQCAALRLRQGIHRSQDRADQLMQPGRRQLGFGFDTGRPRYTIPRSCPRRAAASTSTDLPTPGSPQTAMALPPPPAASTAAVRTSSSRSRDDLISPTTCEPAPPEDSGGSWPGLRARPATCSLCRLVGVSQR